MTRQWIQGKGSRLKHFYIDDKALCGSKAKPGNAGPKYYEYCRKCKKLKAKKA